MSFKDHMVKMVQQGKVKAKGKAKASKAMKAAATAKSDY